MKVSEWIRAHPGSAITVRPEQTVDELLDRLLGEACLRDLYVVDERGRLIGHISHRSLAHVVLAPHRPVHTYRQIMDRVARGAARDLMQTDFCSAHPDEELDSVLHRQLEHDAEDMPIIGEDGSLLGAVNLSEVLRAVRAGTLDGP